jgi:putative endonuclease
MTNSLKERLHFHNNPEAHSKSFSHKYKCKNLIYYERFSNVEEAIKREKQLKKWRRDKKEWLIKLKNPDLKVLNDEI